LHFLPANPAISLPRVLIIRLNLPIINSQFALLHCPAALPCCIVLLHCPDGLFTGLCTKPFVVDLILWRIFLIIAS